MSDSDSPHLLACELTLAGDDPAATRKLHVTVRHAGGPPAEEVRVLVRFAQNAEVGLGFQLEPERALLGKLTGDVDFHVSRIAGTVTHAWLFHVRSAHEDVGSVEVRYRDPNGGERTLAASLGHGTAVVEAEGELTDRRRAAAVAVEAYRDGNRARCREQLASLLETAPAEESGTFQEMMARLEAGATLTAEMLDLCFRISRGDETEKTDARVFDVVLLDAGDAPIAVVREIRAATSLPLRDVGEIVADQVPIGHALPFAQAGNLKRLVESAGGTAELRGHDPSATPPPDPDDAEPENETDEEKRRKRRRRRRGR